MKKSELTSGMVIEVLEDGEVVRYLLTELVDGSLIAFNDKYTLGEVDYYFDEDLNNTEPEVELLGVYTLNKSNWHIWKAISLDECLELVYEPRTKTSVSVLAEVLQRADSLGILEANLEQLLNPHEIMITNDVVGDLVDYISTDIEYTLS